MKKNWRLADFTCIRRANDVSQSGNFIASPNVGEHSELRNLVLIMHKMYMIFLRRWTKKVHIFSSAMKTNSQYMHVIRFSIGIRGEFTED